MSPRTRLARPAPFPPKLLSAPAEKRFFCAQGHDDIGRPLLERALAIQEQALGPDHPDVLAIKDVLNSD